MIRLAGAILFAVAILTVPLTAAAQQGSRVARVGVLRGWLPTVDQAEALEQGCATSGGPRA